MNKVNYDEKMREIIGKLEYTPKLLLHSCCAPCSSYCITELSGNFSVTVFYYNPNIDTDEEYEHRKEEQERFIKEGVFANPVAFVGEEHEKEDFLKIAKGLENEPERGKRCLECYRLRLKKTAEYAKQNGYEYFTTTLTLSPLKNAEAINEIGFELQEETGVRFLPSDFKKSGGDLKSIELSKEYNLYRQNYCGCEFSKRTNG